MLEWDYISLRHRDSLLNHYSLRDSELFLSLAMFSPPNVIQDFHEQVEPLILDHRIRHLPLGPTAPLFSK